MVGGMLGMCYVACVVLCVLGCVCSSWGLWHIICGRVPKKSLLVRYYRSQ